MTERRRETETKGERHAETESKTGDKETISLKRQSDEEYNSSGETDHMRVVHLH